MTEPAFSAASACTDPIAALVEHAHRLTYESLPEREIQHQRRRVLDNIACAFTGVRAAGVEGLHTFLRSQHSGGDVSILGLGERMSVRDAAMQNSLMARAWDFCDVISPGYHPSSTDVPIALAVGELCQSSGRELIAALAAGQDIAVRINAAAQKNGFFYNGFDSNILAPIAGSIVAGKLLQLNESQLRAAIGLAFNTCAGSFQAVQDKVLAVRLAQANATRNSIESALLALAGFSGIQRILGGEHSFFRLFAQREPDLQALTADLGQHFPASGATCFKLYPSCGVTLALTDAALAMNAHAELLPSHILTGRVRVSPTMMMLCGQPFAPGATPEVDAMFSIQYVAANALCRGSSQLTHFTRAAIDDPQVRSLAARIEVIVDAQFRHADECELSVTLDDGETRCVKAIYGKGWPQNPASDLELEAKLAQCVTFSGLPLDADAIAGQLRQLEEARNVRSLVRELLVVQ